MRFAVSIGLGIGLGFWIDKKLNSFPLFLVVGFLPGFASVFLSLYRAVVAAWHCDSPFLLQPCFSL